MSIDSTQRFLDVVFERLLNENASSLMAMKALIVEGTNEIRNRESAATSEAPIINGRKRVLRAEHLPDVCSPQVAADYLQISRTRVYEYCGIAPEAGGIPSYTIGGSRKIDKADLLRWKEAQKARAAERFAHD
ncbi:helix-turn-helix domain-containing protein [Cohnella herbarum]|uniref:Helix-turn-helix domain-containing protein n=1 Tax=Cohnella herbarum TaxID=2728023 RepID=A0A7Z2VQG8_9BACL|nr:helix-turn-helix domain-containing protein [Cohnella herbarum]QJD87588.1 helix-turn-helix domain-containing protein [Cohnella herbarum]